MKTLKKRNSIIRVKENEVDAKLKEGYTYTTKKEWKENVRDANDGENQKPNKNNKK